MSQKPVSGDKPPDAAPAESEDAHASVEPAGGRRAAGYFATVVLGGAVIAVLAVLTLSDGGNDESNVATAQAFRPDYAQLESRRQAAGVSTMGNPEDASSHFHPRLAVYANGEQITIPVNIGIDPSQSPEQMASLHTHETDGTIHVEGMSEPTLGQLFEIWGVPFSERELGPYREDGDKTVRMWVEGEPSEDFGELKLADGQQIVVAYGAADQMPTSLVP